MLLALHVILLPSVLYCIPSSVLYFVCTIDVDAKEPTLVEGPNTRSYLILSYLIMVGRYQCLNNWTEIVAEVEHSRLGTHMMSDMIS